MNVAVNNFLKISPTKNAPAKEGFPPWLSHDGIRGRTGISPR